jgi:hypothetical protein
MFGRGVGWGVAPMGHTLAVVVGGLSSRPAVVGSSIEPREFLCLTLTWTTTSSTAPRQPGSLLG